MASDLVALWRSRGVPASARSAAGLRSCAELLVGRAAAGPELVGWTMVTIVSEYWRDRLASIRPGRRLVLLPDCPRAAVGRQGVAEAASSPAVCGPACGVATMWAAARDGGWVVEPTSRALTGIGALLTGQYEGVLGVAPLADLEKAFAMLPAFALPVAAVPMDPAAVSGGDHGAGRSACVDDLASCGIDLDWMLGLVGVAGDGGAAVDDFLPLLHEAAAMFLPDALSALADRIGIAPGPTAGGPGNGHAVHPLDATAAVAGEFLGCGGKFLRPFICLAAFDAVRHDRGAETHAVGRDAVKAAAVAIEMFHKASLIHDDIEDADDMRYGRATVHVEHGVPFAINAGDYLLGLGYRWIASLPDVDAETARDLVAILADAHVRLSRGQGAELWWRDRGDKRLATADALEIYGLKTSPAFEAAICMGIRLAGGQPRSLGDVATYALHVGTAFQLLNDLKDWSGDLENNRRAAGDLLGGRPTAMWALALERVAPTAAEQLRRLASTAGRPDATERDVTAAVAAARSIYAEADVFGRASALVADRRRWAASAAAACRGQRLREILEFMLDLAVPEPAAGGFTA